MLRSYTPGGRLRPSGFFFAISAEMWNQSQTYSNSSYSRSSFDISS